MKRLVLPESPGRGLALWIVGFSALVISAIILHAIWFYEQQRTETVQRALTDGQNLASSLEEYTRTTLTWAQFSLNSVAGDIEDALSDPGPDAEPIATILKRASDDTPESVFFIYADASGDVTTSYGPGSTSQANIADAPYFQAARNGGEDGFALVRPHWLSGGDKPMLGLVHSVRGRDGRFAGIAVVTLDSGHFQAIHARLDLGKDSTIAVFSRDGIMIARVPYRRDFIGTSFAGDPVFKAIADSRLSGGHRARHRDGVTRFVSYRTMEDFPVVVALGRAESEVLTPLRASGIAAVSYVAALIAVVAVLAALMILLARRQDRVNSQLFAMLANSNQGIAVFDRHQRLVSCNRRYSAEMFEFPPGFIRPGVAYGDILRFLASHGEYGERNSDKIIENRLATLDQPEEQRIVHRRPNGTLLIIFRKPIAEGGFIITFTDITEDVRNREEAEAQSRLLSLVLDSIQQGIRVFDKDLNLVLANRRLVDTFGYPEDFARPGMSYESTIRIAASFGEYGDDDMEKLVSERLVWGRDGVNHGSIRRTPNGRYVKKQRDPIPGGGFISTYIDVTELIHAEEEIARKSALLELTQEHIGDGISVYDENRRLINFNKRWAELWDMPPSLARIGTSYEDIMKRQISCGFTSPTTDPEAYIQSRIDDLMANKMTTSELNLPDGRTIMIRRYAAPNGIIVTNHTDITPLKRIEREAARKSTLLEAVLENMAQGMLVCDAGLRVVAYNAKFAELQGYPPQDMRIGMSYEDLLRVAAAAGNLKVDDLDAAIAERLKSARIRQPYYKEYLAHSGRYITLRRAPMPDGGFVSTVVDTTARKNAEVALAGSEARYRSLVMSSAQLIWTTDAEGHVIEPQPTWQAFTGQSDEEILAGGWFKALHPDDMEQAQRSWRTALETKSFCTFEYRLRRRDGLYRTFSVRAVPVLDADQTVREWVGICEDISERKQAEAEVVAKSALLEATLQNMAQGVIVHDRNFRLAAYNQRYLDLMQFPPGFITLGKNFEDVLRFLAKRGDLGENPEEQVARRLLGARTSKSFQHESPRPDGRTLIVSQAPMPGGGFIRTFTDISDRKRAERALSESEQRLRVILDNMADAVLTTDGEGAIQSYNAAAETIFGYTAEQAIGMNIRHLIPGPIRPRNQAQDEGGRESTEMAGCRRDGSTFPIDIAVTSVDLSGRRLQIAIVRDIGEQKGLQAQLFQASKLATLGEMAAAMAHEMNQPLNVVRMAADNGLIRMERGIATDDYLRQNLALIASQAERLGKLVLHMRVFSRIEPTEFEPFDPRLSVAAAIELMSGQLELTNIRVTTFLPGDCGQVMGRPAQLEQVIINLLSNAQDAIVAHPQRAADSTIGSIDLTLTDSDGIIRIKVADTGGGIPPGVIGRIFDPFFTTKEVGKGTGLGLSVSYGMVSAMGGKIDVAQDERGATFTVILPVHKARKTRGAKPLQIANRG